MRCEERFSKIYKRDPESHTFCPYRVCPIGAHVDHNLGKITGIPRIMDIGQNLDVNGRNIVMLG